MHPIINNPYRTLGLFGNSSERDIQKQIAIIRRFAEVGKSKSFDSDFLFFGKVERNIDELHCAASKIEQAKNKVHHALFWFIQNTEIDEIALNNLKEGNIDKAKEIWEKILKTTTISEKNYSAASNLSTLQLGLVTMNGSFNLKMFISSLSLKSKLLSSNAFKIFVETIAGESVVLNTNELEKEFVENILILIQPYLKSENGLSIAQFVRAFDKFSPNINKLISSNFTDAPISNIEHQIESARANRAKNPSKADKYGEELYLKTKQDILFLRSVFAENNVQLQILSNKLVEEILQCAIEYFVAWKDKDSLDPGESALKIMKMAKSVNSDGPAKNRLDENIDNIHDWIKSKPERDKISKVKGDLEILNKNIGAFQSYISMFGNDHANFIHFNNPLKESLKFIDAVLKAKDFVIKCKPKLDNLKSVLGTSDSLFLNISSFVVYLAEQLIVIALNKSFEIISNRLLSREFNFITLITNALEVNFMLDYLSMDQDTNLNHKKNSESLVQIANKFSISRQSCYTNAKNTMASLEKTSKPVTTTKTSQLKSKTTTSHEKKSQQPVTSAQTSLSLKNTVKTETNRAAWIQGFKFAAIFGLIGLVIGFLFEGTPSMALNGFILGAVAGFIYGSLKK